MESICLECGGSLRQPRTGRPKLYCSGRCRQAAHRRTLTSAQLAPVGRLESIGSQCGALPPSAHPDDQVAAAILEARNLAGAFLRLGREARPQLAWRCEGVGSTLQAALIRYFKEIG